jgi:hypothetical protein
VTQDGAREFRTTVGGAKNGGVSIELPFDANEAWGAKTRHHVSGTVNGMKVRGPLTEDAGSYRLILGPAWCRDCGVGPGDEASVVLWAEGPQLEGLAPDLVAALEVDPAALEFWQGLATFYRKAYLKWIDGASRRPEVRKERLRELVRLLKAGKRERQR